MIESLEISTWGDETSAVSLEGVGANLKELVRAVIRSDLGLIWSVRRALWCFETVGAVILDVVSREVGSFWRGFEIFSEYEIAGLRIETGGETVC